MRGEVYSCSGWTALRAAELYYLEGRSQKEIGEALGLSPATVSRALRRAREEGYIRFAVPEPYAAHLSLARALCARFGLRDAVVTDCAGDAEARKRAAALEGARYIECTLRPGDVLGLAWGGTMYHLVHLLNPCRRTDNAFVTLHGSLRCCGSELDAATLTRRVAMVLGGAHYCLDAPGLQPSPEALAALWRAEGGLRKALARVTVSVSGLGAFAPEERSPLARLDYLPPEDLAELREKGVCADMLLRFFDRDGHEIDSAVRRRTLAMEPDDYRRIPCKILVASGAEKAAALRAVLRGGMADVLIADRALAESALQPTP